MYVGIPNPNILSPLEKMTITPDGKPSFQVLYNPESYVQARKVRYAQSSGISTNTPVSQFAGGSDDFLHRVHTLLTNRWIGRKDESLESCANGAYLDVSSVEGLLDLVHPSGQTSTSWLETDYTQFLHEVELLVQAFSGRYPLLERKFQFQRFLALLLLGLRFRRFRSAGGSHRSSCCYDRSG